MNVRILNVSRFSVSDHHDELARVRRRRGGEEHVRSRRQGRQRLHLLQGVHPHVQGP